MLLKVNKDLSGNAINMLNLLKANVYDINVRFTVYQLSFIHIYIIFKLLYIVFARDLSRVFSRWLLQIFLTHFSFLRCVNCKVLCTLHAFVVC